MPKFTKKPVTISAVKFNGSSTHACQIESWIEGSGVEPVEAGIHARDIRPLYIDTPEGTMEVSPGDWIIQGIAGEYYLCKPDFFEAMYELAE